MSVSFLECETGFVRGAFHQIVSWPRMVRKGQVRSIGGRDMRAQASFLAELFQVAA